MHQYYLGSFLAYGIMAACFNVLAQTIVNRREMGLLKRLRLSPIPTWSMLAAIFVSTILIALYQVVLLMVVGKLGFSDHFPTHWLAFVVTLLVGMLSFTALGMGISTLVPNPDAAGPMISIVFFLLLAFSGLYFPITPGTTLANVSGYFPVRHLITALEGSFNLPPGSPTFAGHDLLVMAIWGLGGALWPSVVGNGRRDGCNRDPVTRTPVVFNAQAFSRSGLRYRGRDVHQRIARRVGPS